MTFHWPFPFGYQPLGGCPTCGHCPTCGRGGHYGYYQPPPLWWQQVGPTGPRWTNTTTEADWTAREAGVTAGPEAARVSFANAVLS